MMKRIRTSWALLEQSVLVLSHNLKLLLFPLISLAATAGIVLFFIGTFLFQPTGHAYSDKAHWETIATRFSVAQPAASASSAASRTDSREKRQLNKSGAIFFVALYFALMFITTFSNVAFYHEIIEALNGQPVGITKGLMFALSRIKAIFFWSMFAGAVGYAIKLMEQRFGLVGRIVIRLIGLAWSVAAVFAIPVIICESGLTNPFIVLKTSAQSIRKTWGEGLIGSIGFSVAIIPVIFGSAVLMIGMVIVAITQKELPLAMMAGVAWVIFIFALSYLTGVARSVYQCALYIFASTGTIPAGYNRQMMNDAWRYKKS